MALLPDGILTFVTVGIYWANHTYIFRLYKKTDHAFNLLNVLFLMCISFVPLPTAVLGEYISLPHQQRAAVIFTPSASGCAASPGI